MDGESESEVAQGLDSKIVRGKIFYLEDWFGFDEAERSWEPANNMRNAIDPVADFHARFPHRLAAPSSSFAP